MPVRQAICNMNKLGHMFTRHREKDRRQARDHHQTQDSKTKSIHHQEASFFSLNSRVFISDRIIAIIPLSVTLIHHLNVFFCQLYRPFNPR